MDISHQKILLHLGQFYGLYHNITPEDNQLNANVPLFFVPRNPNPAPGDLVIIDIILGTPSLPATDIHGLTFALNFNEQIVEPGTMQINFNNGNWMSYNSAMISMVKKPYLGRIEAGYTRTTGVSAFGYGIIGTAEFVIVEDIIDGARERDTLVYTARLETPSAMGSSGEMVNLITQDFDIRIARDLEEEAKEDQLLVFPNPATDQVNVHLNGNNVLEQVTILSITGQEIYRSEKLNGKQFNMPIGDNFATGIYIIHAMTEKGVMNAKLEIVR